MALSDSDQEILADFLVEAWEQIELLDREFVALEEDPNSQERIDNIFRVMHTLKGGAGFLGLEMLECITHYGETLMSSIRQGKLSATKERIGLMLNAADATKTILSHLEKGEGEGDPAPFNDLVLALKRAGTAKPDSSSIERELPKKVAPAPQSQEDPERAEQRREAEDLQAQLMAALSKEDEAPPTSMPTRPLVEEEAEVIATNHPSDTRIRVHVDLLDKLMNLVGELVLSRNQILQVASNLENSGLSSACQRINLVTSELQEHIMQTRMQPISTLLNRFPRVVRDLCNLTGKEARFSMDGQDTGLDRTILEAIKDPLTHILRNSIDHGLESPDKRVRAGKSARGHIHVKACHEGGQVIIEVSDDGAGVDVARVKEKAIAQGLITPMEAEKLTERETLQLLFKPGFSTATQVTNLSGRGVGMDVVRVSVERIGGTVDVTSRAGTGTTVKLRLPLTLAIIPALVVTAGKERYAIPQVSLQELVRLEGGAGCSSIEHVYGAEVYRLRGELLPLLRLRTVLGLPPEESDTINIVVVSADGQPFGLIVDGVCDTEEIVVKPLTRELKQLQVYAGATIMGDGRVALIVDVGGLARSSRLELTKEALAEKHEESARSTVAQLQSLLLFRLGGPVQYAIPLNFLSRLEEFPVNQLETVADKRVVQYRGRLLTLIDMAELLGVHREESGTECRVLVFSHEGRDLGLVVSEILDVVEESVTLESGSSSHGILGRAIVNGKATALIDLYSLIRSSEPDWLKPAQTNSDSQKGARVLLVDDSQFCGAVTSSYLQLAGLTVSVCRDNQGVLDRVSRESYDYIIVEAGTKGARQILDALSSSSSSYRDRLLATCQRGQLEYPNIPLVDPFGRDELLEALQGLQGLSLCGSAH